MPSYEFAVVSEKTGSLLKSGFKSIGDAWDWMRENSCEGFVTFLVSSNNKETL